MNLVVCNYFVFAEMRSWERTWGLRATPEMSARDAEVMANAMLLDSPFPNLERANEEIPEDGGSERLPGEGEGEKLPKGGDDK